MAASRSDLVCFYTFTRQPSKPPRPNVLECRVCEDVFGFQGNKVPRLLYCGHTLCHSCLLRLPLRDSNILCPFDRQPTPVADSGVWGLKKNFALLELLEKLHYSGEKPALFCSEALAKERELGIPCDENESHSAVLYCTVCATHLCEECSESTHSTRTLAKHRRVPLSEKPREKPKCAHHPDHLVEFTCLESDCESSPLMCFICKDYGRHQGHKHALLEAEAHGLRSTVLSTVGHLKKFAEEVGDTGRQIEQAIGQIEGEGGGEELLVDEVDGNPNINTTYVPGTAEVARGRVRAYFEELREHLHMQEVAALTVVDTHVRERLGSLRQHREDLVILLTQVANVCAQCERLAQQDDARLLLASREIKALLTSVEQHQQQVDSLATEQISPDPLIPITFTKDNRVHIGPKIEMRVVMLGLDGAGKTSILFKLKQNEFMPTIPTIGFNVEMVEYKNLKFTFWDVGGQPKLRLLWKHYYLNTQAVIFVLDSCGQDRLQEAHSELAKLMAEKELKDASLLIFANKQDLAGSISIEEVTQRFSLYKLCCGRSWHIQACDAQSGTGLGDGLDWLSRQLVAAGVHDAS